MPTGVRTPVAIMSMRPRAGAVHAPTQPGRCEARSSFSTSSDGVSGPDSGQRKPSTRRSAGGLHPEYHHRVRDTFRPLGARPEDGMVVSAIE